MRAGWAQFAAMAAGIVIATAQLMCESRRWRRGADTDTTAASATTAAWALQRTTTNPLAAVTAAGGRAIRWGRFAAAKIAHTAAVIINHPVTPAHIEVPAHTEVAKARRRTCTGPRLHPARRCRFRPVRIQVGRKDIQADFPAGYGDDLDALLTTASIACRPSSNTTKSGGCSAFFCRAHLSASRLTTK